MPVEPPRMGWWVSDLKAKHRDHQDFPLDLDNLHTGNVPANMHDEFDRFRDFAHSNFSSASLITKDDCGYDLPIEGPAFGGSAFLWGWSDHDGVGQASRSGSVRQRGVYVKPHLRYLSCPDRLNNAADFRAWLTRMRETPSGIPHRQVMMGHIQRHASTLVAQVGKVSWPDRINLRVGHHQGVVFNDIKVDGEKDSVWSPEGNWKSHIMLHGAEGIVVTDADRTEERARYGFPADYAAEKMLANYLSLEDSNLTERTSMSASMSGTWRCAPQAFREVALVSRMMQIIADPDRGGRKSMQKANIHPRPHLTAARSLTHIYEMMRIVHVEKTDGEPTSYLASSMGEFVSPAMEPSGFGGEGYGQSLPLFCIPVNMVGGRNDLTFGDWIVIGTHAMPSSDDRNYILTGVHGENGVYDVMKPDSESRSNTVLVGIRDRVINIPNTPLTKHYFSPSELMHMAVASERVTATHTVDETQVKTDARNIGRKWVPTWKDNRGKKTINLAGRKKVRLHDIVRCSTCNGKVEIKADIGNTTIVGKCPHCSDDSVHFPHLVMGADIPKTGPARSQ